MSLYLIICCLSLHGEMAKPENQTFRWDRWLSEYQLVDGKWLDRAKPLLAPSIPKESTVLTMNP